MSASQPNQSLSRAVHENAFQRLEPPQAQLLFREVNEQILAVSGNANTDARFEVVCECSNPHCFEVLPMTLADYEDLRLFPTRFVVKPTHLVTDDERVVAETNDFTVVEKLGPAAQAAIRRDPRRRLALLASLTTNDDAQR